MATCDPRLGEDVSKFGSVFKDWLKLKSTSNLTSRLEAQVQYQNMPRLYFTLVNRLRKLTGQCYLYQSGHRGALLSGTPILLVEIMSNNIEAWIKDSCYTSFDLNHRIEYSDRNITTLKLTRGCSSIRIDANSNGKYDDLKTSINVNVEGTIPSNYTTS